MTNDVSCVDYTVSSDRALLQFDSICALLATTYWAKNRPAEVVRTAIDNSVCFGVYHMGKQVGFARVVSDFATMFYVADVVIGEAHRGKGLGKMLISHITQDVRFQPLLGLLATNDAHGLYEQFGFIRDGDRLMMKPRASQVFTSTAEEKAVEDLIESRCVSQ